LEVIKNKPISSVFVVRNCRYGTMGAFSLQMVEMQLNCYSSPNSTKNQGTRLSHQKNTKIDLSPRVFVLEKGRYSPICMLGGLPPQMTEMHVGTMTTGQKLKENKVQDPFIGNSRRMIHLA
jgi:hypothetical protein